MKVTADWHKEQSSLNPTHHRTYHPSHIRSWSKEIWSAPWPKLVRMRSSGKWKLILPKPKTTRNWATLAQLKRSCVPRTYMFMPFWWGSRTILAGFLTGLWCRERETNAVGQACALSRCSSWTSFSSRTFHQPHWKNELNLLLTALTEGSVRLMRSNVSKTQQLFKRNCHINSVDTYPTCGAFKK